jgi:2,4-dienoyl-CoA reductase-like NADH-dependent reductase (Old Yellow Enzyme family)
MLQRITTFIKSQGAVAGMQLAHAGRKASTARPWEGGAPIGPDQGGWQPIVAPSAIPFDKGYQVPQMLSVEEIAPIVQSFAHAAKRALAAGFEVIELHAAHGYLLHEFLSPLTNKRQDHYGGSLENRMRAVLETIRALRKVWPERLPLWMRISATDWVENGWDPDQSVELARRAKTEGVDLVDCSSGAIVPDAKIPVGPGFQVPFAEKIRKEVGILTGAVGLITEPSQAETILQNGQADVILMARQFLREAYFPLHAASTLHEKPHSPVQYGRAF